jgi:hypothetical protein
MPVQIQHGGELRSGVGCEGDRNYFVVMILSIVQDIWATFGRGVGVGGDMKRILLDCRVVRVGGLWHYNKRRVSWGNHKMWT